MNQKSWKSIVTPSISLMLSAIRWVWSEVIDVLRAYCNCLWEWFNHIGATWRTGELYYSGVGVCEVIFVCVCDYLWVSVASVFVCAVLVSSWQYMYICVWVWYVCVRVGMRLSLILESMILWHCPHTPTYCSSIQIIGFLMTCSGYSCSHSYFDSISNVLTTICL